MVSLSERHNKRHGIGGAVLGIVVVVVIIVAALAGYFAASSGISPSTTTSTQYSTITQPAVTSTVTNTVGVTQTNTVTVSGTVTQTITGTATTVTTTATQTTTSISTTTSTATVPHLPAATLTVGGGTLVYPIMQDWISTYSYVQPNIQITYNAVGSGTGISNIAKGLYNFGESDAPLTAAQYASLPSGSNLLTVPISDSGIVPAYNLPGVTAHLNFTGNVLAEIFYGTITAWNDPRIASLQSPSVASQLPNHAIQVYHRSDGSGTMYGFTQYLSDSNATWAKNVGFSTGTLAWPVGVGCLHNAGVAQCIAGNTYSIGPLEIAYEIANPGQINYGAVKNAAGHYVLANLADISAALAAGVRNGLPSSPSQWSSYSVIQQTFNYTADATIYPISTFTYALIYQSMSASYAATTQAQATAVVNFLEWVITSGQATGPNDPTTTLGYPPLPQAAVSLSQSLLASVTYNGTPVLSGS